MAIYKKLSKYKYAYIPYESITTDQVNNSVVGDKDKMPRTFRNDDILLVKYLLSNASYYTDYPQNDTFDSESLFYNTEIESALKSDDLTISTNIGLEISHLEITTAGATYSAGTLTATGGGGDGYGGSGASGVTPGWILIPRPAGRAQAGKRNLRKENAKVGLAGGCGSWTRETTNSNGNK